MQIAIQKIGNSQGVIIPKVLINQLGLTDKVELKLTDNAILLSNPQKVRQGWLEAAKKIAQDEHTKLADFANTDDEAWVW